MAVSRKIWAERVPQDIAAAIKARDRGDRFPGSRRPIEHLHHLDKRGKGHDVDALVGLAGVSHTRVHRFKWKVTIDGREATFTRGDRSWTTLPRGTKLRRPPDDPDPPSEKQASSSTNPNATRRHATGGFGAPAVRYRCQRCPET